MALKDLFNIKIVTIATVCAVHWGLCEAGLRIYGGRDALKNEYPFTVRLEEEYKRNTDGKTYIEYRLFCSGAALTSSWILSAAHCGDDNFYKIYFDILIIKVRKLARYNSYFPKDSGQLSPITKMLVYPGFMFNKPISKQVSKYDIALFRTENILVSQYGKISAIDYKSLVGHEAVVLGFGANNAKPTEKPFQVLKGMLTKCDAPLTMAYGFLCVVPRCGQETTICGGDSGGPVVHATGIIGVNSFSMGDCDEISHILYPGHAAAGVSIVSPAVDWISNIIGNKTA